MPLIPYADTAALPDDARQAFDALPRKLNIFRMWANAATCFRPGLSFGTAILSKQKLAPDLRELIILGVARLEGGIYEWVQHVPIGERAGCTKAQIAALEALRFEDAGFDARAKAMLRLVREVVRDVKASEGGGRSREGAVQQPRDRRDHPDRRLLHDHGADDGDDARGRRRAAGRGGAGVGEGAVDQPSLKGRVGFAA